MRRWKYAVGPGNNDPLCAQPHTKIAHMKRTTWLMQFLFQGQCTPGLSCEGSDHASECLISAGPRLLRRQRGKGMPDLHSLVIRIAKRCGMVTGGIHEGLSAQENRWDTTIFQGQDVVHTARHTRASISDRSDNKVAPFGQFVDDGWLRKARIDEFSMVHGL
jgi:hypothetical protein